jgi:hypothetical protein
MRLLIFSSAFFVFLFGNSLGEAHSWYPLWCCSEQDCHELMEERGETVLEVPYGFKLWDGRMIKRETAQLSPDTRFHLCERQDKSVICFFAPPGAT